MLLSRCLDSLRLAAWPTAVAMVACTLLGCAGLHRPGIPFGRDLVDVAVDRVKPALVRIHVVNAQYYQGRESKSQAGGSGVIISTEGYVVTNHHVAGDAIRIFCTMSDREEIPAELVGTDPMSDIAVLKLIPDRPRSFPYARWGDSDKLAVGDTVLAMGSPLTLSQSVTEGIVSNTEMTLPSLFGRSAFELDGENVGSIVRWIGHDASIYGGNSGGPLVDLSGRIVGINEIRMGLGGAIPSNLARQITRQLIDQGRVHRAFLGLLLQPRLKHEKLQRGAIVSDVVEDSPAAVAGIESGDRLLRLGGRAINLRFEEELPPLNLFVSSLKIGKPLQVVFERNGERLVKTLTPELREPALRDQDEFKQWGFTARGISMWKAIELKRETSDGVLVTSVQPGGPSGQSNPALAAGDIILEIQDTPILSTDDLRALTDQLINHEASRGHVLVTFERDGSRMITLIEPGLKNLRDPGREVRKAWIPVATQVITRELADKLGLGSAGGVRVTRLYEEAGTTASLGLQVGDLILSLDGQPIPAYEAHDVEVLPAMIRQYPIGSEVRLTVLRRGQRKQLSLALPARPPQPREMKRYRDIDFEFTVRNMAYLDRKKRQLSERIEGVVVEQVQNGGWASLGHLESGDLLMAIDGTPTPTVARVRRLLQEVRQRRPESVVFKVRKNVFVRFLEIEPVWEDTPDEGSAENARPSSFRLHRKRGFPPPPARRPGPAAARS